ncbi:MAG: 2,3-diphosphoglycerate synthetase [Actinomycetota bacterium]|jgi:cyclic 2,3-diphosphoglycerate synthetase|nr:2,3-diphosphoglycerate synthetase [Actinomycetota bacterium]
MTRVVALIDGEHYPPVVRFALAGLGHEYDVVAAAFIGGTEKVDLQAGMATYGVPVVTAATAAEALALAIDRYDPCAVIDLSDDPVLSPADRFELATVALSRGVEYRGADFVFSPPRSRMSTKTPTLALIGTGKRVGKTAVSAYVARRLKAAGRDVVVLAMGRGGPSEPELIEGEHVQLTTSDLLELARQGKHASSDNYEDAVMSRVTTVGCRRCGGGLAGETFFSNVPDGARLADSLGKELIMLEGSGAAIPPVACDATILVVGAGRGIEYVRDYFGPYRLGLADLVVIASAEEPVASVAEVDAIRDEIARRAPGVPCVVTTFRPVPLEPIAGKRVFFATTAPEGVVPKLSDFLQTEFDCEVVAASAHLSNRELLRRDMQAAGGSFDVLVTELKAAAIDVVAAAGEEAGVPTVLCDNLPIALDGSDLGVLVESVAATAIDRGLSRKA